MDRKEKRNVERTGYEGRHGKSSQKIIWNEIGKMMGRMKKERMEILKNENGEKLRTKEEVKEEFRKRLERPFRISDGKNEEFSEDTKRRVEEWIRENEDELKVKDRVT